MSADAADLATAVRTIGLLVQRLGGDVLVTYEELDALRGYVLHSNETPEGFHLTLKPDGSVQ